LVEEWYNSFEEDADHLSTISGIQKQRLKSRIRQRIKNNISLFDDDAKGGGGARMRYIGYAISGIAASLVISFMFLHKQQKPIVVNERLITVTNTTKNIQEQVLSDGSHVWMMPGAQLKYNQVFAGSRREVTLSGESFFEVTKNPARPFIIYSGNLIAKVWGTSFRVRDSKELAYADVTVLTGKVSVKLIHPNAFSAHNKAVVNTNMPAEVMIYPNQQVTYVKKGQLFTEKPKADMSALLIWKKTSITFDNTPLKDVIPVLNKAYNVNITTANDKLNAYLLNADFNGINLPDIMEILHKALDINYEIKGRQIILKDANNQ